MCEKFRDFPDQIDLAAFLDVCAPVCVCMSLWVFPRQAQNKWIVKLNVRVLFQHGLMQSTRPLFQVYSRTCCKSSSRCSSVWTATSSRCSSQASGVNSECFKGTGTSYASEHYLQSLSACRSFHQRIYLRTSVGTACC